ncbi:hypothetical protein Tco_0612290 [Tanacetum coccineum]
MEKAARYTSNKYVEAALNSATIVLPYLVPCEEFLRDLHIEFHERALLENSKRHFAKDCFSKTSEPSYKSPVTGYSSVSKGFQPKFTPKLIQSSQNSISQADPKVQKDYKAGYKKMNAKLALLKANPSMSQTPKTFQPKNKVLMALADDELNVGKNHARNDEWIEITMRKVNILLSMDEDADWQNYLKYINIDLKFVEEQRLNLLSKYNKIVFELNKCRDELLVLKQAKLDAVTFQIQNTELTKLNHALQEQLKEEKKINEKWLTSSKKTESSKSVDSSKISQDSKPKVQNTGSSKSLRPKPIQKLQLREDHRTSDHEMYMTSLKRSENYKAQPYQYASPSKQILKAKAKPPLPCTHYGF